MVIDIERIKRLISEIRNATSFILDLTKNPLNLYLKLINMLLDTTLLL